MILTEEPIILDAGQFAAGLEAASRGVVRVVVTKGGATLSVSTGWLITDDLVVVPAFAIPLSEVGDLSVAPSVDGAEPIAAIQVTGDGASRPAFESGFDADLDESLPILLRLVRPLRHRALPLAVATPRPSEPVFLLHHPQGAASLMMSWGRLIGLHGAWIRHDADTEAGSAGAPVFTATWQVLGMHTRSSSPNDPDGRYNAGISISVLLDRLQASSAWREIAAHHHLADVTGAREQLATAVSSSASPPTAPKAVEDDLLRAAVMWTIDPAKLPDRVRDRLATMVVDRARDPWTLRGDQRARLIGAASVKDLRAARGTARIPGAGQAVIDRILAGPPYDLEQVDEADLPLWLQAVRWFADGAAAFKDLPTPGDIHRTLAQRRTRSRLTAITGPGFRGRKAELTQLDQWMGEAIGGMIAVTGIGGVGKSALVSKLALDLPLDTVLLWLDFDRADLAPDDPVSVLTILFEQLALAVPGVRLPSVEVGTWLDALGSLGPDLSPHLGARGVLLVLDGFEVAQHAPLHEQLWDLLKLFLDQLPRTNVIVSGRAPVAEATIAGRPVMKLHLTGLGPEESEAWLRDAGVDDRDVLDAVLDMTKGVPLILRLAVDWIKSGGIVADLPEELPEQMVQGFLYQRILDRVVDPELKPIARDILVLRRVTPAMLRPIVDDSIPKGADVPDIFRRLSQEMALVKDSDEASTGAALPVAVAASAHVLELRPEVRAATLHLLEAGPDARRVKTIDRRAAKWYASQPLDDPAIRAELVYHRLRLGDLKGATDAWDDACLPFLVSAVEDLPLTATRTRSWLRKKLGSASHDPTSVVRSWEADALARLRSMLARGLASGVSQVLAEKKDRSPGSPLVVYDAWVAWRNGDVARARSILGDVVPQDGPQGRDRAVLAARLAVAAGDLVAADAFLAAVEAEEQWLDRPQAVLDATTVTAARIRLSIDLDAELALWQRLADRSGADPDALHALPPADVVLPLLARHLNRTGGYESLGERLPIPMSPSDHADFAARINASRLSGRPPGVVVPIEVVPPAVPVGDVPTSSEVDPVPMKLPSDPRVLATHIEAHGVRRWSIAAYGPFLARAFETLLAATGARDPQPMAIGGTLAAFAGNEWGPFRLVHPSVGPLDQLLRRSPLDQLPILDPPPSVRQLEQALTLLEAAAKEWTIPSRPDLGPLRAATADGITGPRSLAARSAASKELLDAYATAGPGLEGIGPYVLSPDPLDVLVRRVLSVPDQLAG